MDNTPESTETEISIKKVKYTFKENIDGLGKYANEVLHGHIQIKSLNIDYNVPEEVISYHHWKNRVYIFLAASLLGVIAVFLAWSCDESFQYFKIVNNKYPWLFFIITPFGLVFLRWITLNYFKGSEGSGIPQVIAGMESSKSCKKEALSVRAALGKLFGTNFALLIGASVGREGPTVQFGAIILRLFSKVLKAPVIYSERSLILAGGAAGVSAAFNTPIAGIVFAIEELGKSFYEKETSVLLMAIVVSGLAALSLSGPYFYFGTTDSQIVGFDQLYAIPLGIIGGYLGGLFSLCLMRGSKFVNQLSTRNSYYLVFLFGLIIVAIGYYTDGATFGTGYEEAKAFLDGKSGDTEYPALKFITTVLTYMCGIPGGVFAPTLSIGAGIGHWFMQSIEFAGSQAFILLGMVSFFSGVIRSPITAVIIVSEMTHNHSLLLPLLLVSLISFGTSKLVSKTSLYHALAENYLHPKN